MRALYKYRDLIWTLVARDLRVRYRRSFIGFFWTMLQPLLTMGVLVIVFSSIFRFDIENYPVYALGGILIWNFFQQSITTSMNSLKTHSYILKKLPVPMSVFPLSTVISGLVNLFFALIPLFAILLLTGHPITTEILFLPVSILIVAVFTLGAGLLLAPLAVFFTDVIEMIGVILTLLFYMTPIIYPMSIIEGQPFYPLIAYCPTRPIVEIFRDPIYLNEIPSLYNLGFAGILAILALLLGSWVFRKTIDRVPFFL